MTRYQDDFCDAINGEWRRRLKSQQMKSQTGGFVDLDQEVKTWCWATGDEWLVGEEVPEDAILANFVKYHLVRDLTRGEAVVLHLFATLLKRFQEWELCGLHCWTRVWTAKPLPSHVVSTRLWMLEWKKFYGLALQKLNPADTTYYAEDHPQREELLTLWKESSTKSPPRLCVLDAEIEDLLEKKTWIGSPNCNSGAFCEESSEVC